MRAADVEEVMMLAESLKDAPHWRRAAYLEALNAASAVWRVALVAEIAAEMVAETAAENAAAGSMARPVAGPVAGSMAGSMVGFAVASLVGGEAELETIAVAARSQRQGVGRQLLAAMARELRLAGARNVRLEVRASNRPAMELYRASGYAETSRRPAYYAGPVEDAVLMDLLLGS